jgi:hypothetical protein
VSGVRLVVAAGVMAASLTLGACDEGSRSQASGHRSTITASTTRAAGDQVATTLPPEAGFRGLEDFCAGAPLTGHVLYDGTAGQVVPGILTAAVGGLPPNSAVYVDWSNDHIRGYIVGAFKTDSAGTPIPSSVRMSRLAETRGVEMVLESVSVPPTVFGRLEPCQRRT